MTTSVRYAIFIASLIILVILLSSGVVFAYIPSVHSHEHALVTILKPTIKKPASTTTAEAKQKLNTITRSKLASASASRTKWGTDHENPEEYWFDNRIHSLGNHGFGGAVHAALAPFSTKFIDMASYHGVDIRLKVSCQYFSLSLFDSRTHRFCL